MLHLTLVSPSALSQIGVKEATCKNLVEKLKMNTKIISIVYINGSFDLMSIYTTQH